MLRARVSAGSCSSRRSPPTPAGLIGAHYAASKAGLHGLAHSLARQGASHGVTVNVVASGVDRHRHDPCRARKKKAARRKTRAVGRLGSAEEAADLIAAVVRKCLLKQPVDRARRRQPSHLRAVVAGPDAVVVGAGVIGLTSAVLLAESGLAVECWTADPPAETTSRVAGALWAASPLQEDPDGSLVRWARASLETFVQLAGQPSTGVRVAHGTVASREQRSAPLQMFPGLRLQAADPPHGCLAAFELDAPLIDMGRYLEYLQQRLRGAGATIVARRAALAVRARRPRTAGRQLQRPRSARAGGRRTRSAAVRGQHVVVANPGLEEFFMEDRGAPEWACWFPHGERIVLGGVAQPGAVDLQPDAGGLRAAILERCAALEPRLARRPRTWKSGWGCARFRPSVRARGRAAARRPLRAQLRPRPQRREPLVGLRRGASCGAAALLACRPSCGPRGLHRLRRDRAAAPARRARGRCRGGPRGGPARARGRRAAAERGRLAVPTRTRRPPRRARSRGCRSPSRTRSRRPAGRSASAAACSRATWRGATRPSPSASASGPGVARAQRDARVRVQHRHRAGASTARR